LFKLFLDVLTYKTFSDIQFIESSFPTITDTSTDMDARFNPSFNPLQNSTYTSPENAQYKHTLAKLQIFKSLSLCQAAAILAAKLVHKHTH